MNALIFKVVRILVISVFEIGIITKIFCNELKLRNSSGLMIGMNLNSNESNKYENYSLDRSISNNNSGNEINILPKLKPIYQDGKYSNPLNTWKEPGALDVFKFLVLSPNGINLPSNKKDLDITLPVVKPILNSFVPHDKLRVIWFGHATVMVQFDNVTILTDPHFSCTANPLKLGIKRYRPVPAKINELPDNLNVVCISHNHYDHLDYDSVIQLNERFKKQLNWFVPLGMKSWFINLGIDNVIELNWWDERTIPNLSNLKVVSTPSQHWSRRGLFDKNGQLWSSWSFIGNKFRFFFAGDTGYNEKLFRTIGQEYGPFNLAAIPIGAYEPNNFLKYQHVNPKEAVLIHKDIRSNLSLGIHWGTFPMSYEHYLDPPKKLTIAMDGQSIAKDKFLTFQHGETRLISLNGTSERENSNDHNYAK